MPMLDSAISSGGGIVNSHPLLLDNRSTRFGSIVALANNKKNSTPQKPNSPLKLSNRLLAQSAIGIFALGFLDAGYSGDWSRIGVISKETEDLLKLAAFLIVPSSLFLVLWLSKKPEDG